MPALQTKGFQFLIHHESRQSLRTVILFGYFVIFQVLILLQKPFLQLDFAFQFYASFAVLFLHHFLMHFSEKKTTAHFSGGFFNPLRRSIYSYLFDFIIMIFFMRSFPQLSSFMLVLQLFILFLASFDLSFVELCALGFLASIGTSLMNLSSFQAGSMQSVLSLTLFNLSYLSVILISSQLKDEIFNLQSDLSKTSKKLHSQAEFSKALIEKMPLGLIVSKDENQILLQNDYLKNYLNLNDQDITDLVVKFHTAFEQSPLKQSDFVYETQMNHEKKVFQLDKMQYFDEEVESDLNILLIKDVTNLRQLENQLKQKEKLAAVGQLAAGIAHEIRNPLAGISGSIQMLSQDATDPVQKKLMNIVLKEIDRLNHLITEFLDYAKPEKKPDQQVDLKSLLEETVQSLKLNPEAQPHLSWQIDLKSEVVLGFKDKLKQAFLNILINSLHAVKDRSDAMVSISLFHEEDSVILSIKDNGIGISPETQQKMFEPFHTTKPKGTGLGLAITHKILDSHNAKIFVNSEVNKGVEFKIKFPMVGATERRHG